MFKAGDLVKLKDGTDKNWNSEALKVLLNPPIIVKKVLFDNIFIDYLTPQFGYSSFFALADCFELYLPTNLICQCNLQRLMTQGCKCGVFLAEKTKKK